MNSGQVKPAELLEQLRQNLSGLAYPQNYRACMISASELVEQAAMSIKDQTPGNRVAELLLLAARLEELSGSHDTSSET